MDYIYSRAKAVYSAATSFGSSIVGFLAAAAPSHVVKEESTKQREAVFREAAEEEDQRTEEELDEDGANTDGGHQEEHLVSGRAPQDAFRRGRGNGNGARRRRLQDTEEKRGEEVDDEDDDDEEKNDASDYEEEQSVVQPEPVNTRGARVSARAARGKRGGGRGRGGVSHVRVQHNASPGGRGGRGGRGQGRGRGGGSGRGMKVTSNVGPRVARGNQGRQGTTPGRAGMTSPRRTASKSTTRGAEQSLGEPVVEKKRGRARNLTAAEGTNHENKINKQLNDEAQLLVESSSAKKRSRPSKSDASAAVEEKEKAAEQQIDMPATSRSNGFSRRRSSRSTAHADANGNHTPLPTSRAPSSSAIGEVDNDQPTTSSSHRMRKRRNEDDSPGPSAAAVPSRSRPAKSAKGASNGTKAEALPDGAGSHDAVHRVRPQSRLSAAGPSTSALRTLDDASKYEEMNVDGDQQLKDECSSPFASGSNRQDGHAVAKDANFHDDGSPHGTTDATENGDRTSTIAPEASGPSTRVKRVRPSSSKEGSRVNPTARTAVQLSTTSSTTKVMTHSPSTQLPTKSMNGEPSNTLDSSIPSTQSETDVIQQSDKASIVPFTIGAGASGESHSKEDEKEEAEIRTDDKEGESNGHLVEGPIDGNVASASSSDAYLRPSAAARSMDASTQQSNSKLETSDDEDNAEESTSMHDASDIGDQSELVSGEVADAGVDGGKLDEATEDDECAEAVAPAEAETGDMGVSKDEEEKEKRDTRAGNDETATSSSSLSSTYSTTSPPISASSSPSSADEGENELEEHQMDMDGLPSLMEPSSPYKASSSFQSDRQKRAGSAPASLQMIPRNTCYTQPSTSDTLTGAITEKFLLGKRQCNVPTNGSNSKKQRRDVHSVYYPLRMDQPSSSTAVLYMPSTSTRASNDDEQVLPTIGDETQASAESFVEDEEATEIEEETVEESIESIYVSCAPSTSLSGECALRDGGFPRGCWTGAEVALREHDYMESPFTESSPPSGDHQPSSSSPTCSHAFADDTANDNQPQPTSRLAFISTTCVPRSPSRRNGNTSAEAHVEVDVLVDEHDKQSSPVIGEAQLRGEGAASGSGEDKMDGAAAMPVFSNFDMLDAAHVLAGFASQVTTTQMPILPGAQKSEKRKQNSSSSSTSDTPSTSRQSASSSTPRSSQMRLRRKSVKVACITRMLPNRHKYPIHFNEAIRDLPEHIALMKKAQYEIQLTADEVAAWERNVLIVKDLVQEVYDNDKKGAKYFDSLKFKGKIEGLNEVDHVVCCTPRQLGCADPPEYFLFKYTKYARAIWQPSSKENLELFVAKEFAMRNLLLDLVELRRRCELGDSHFDRIYKYRYLLQEEGVGKGGYVTCRQAKKKNRLRAIEAKWSLANRRAGRMIIFIEDWTGEDLTDQDLKNLEYILKMENDAEVENMLKGLQEAERFKCNETCTCVGSKNTERSDVEPCCGAVSIIGIDNSTEKEGLPRYIEAKSAEERHVSQLHFECGSDCKCDAATCNNRRMQKGRQDILVVFRDHQKGWTLRATKGISSESCVANYSGVVSRTNDGTKKAQSYDMGMLIGRPGDDGKLEEPLNIRAYEKGNESRFASHSCDPNTVIHMTVPNRDALWYHEPNFRTIRDIGSGEEITIDYGMQIEEDFKYYFDYCLCLSPNCRFPKPTNKKKGQKKNNECGKRH